MPRKGIVSRRVQATDPVYGEALVEKFICSMMWEGKKSTAQRVFYGAMDQVAKKTSDDALKIFKKAIENLKPLVEVKTRRVGGADSGAGGSESVPPTGCSSSGSKCHSRLLYTSQDAGSRWTTGVTVVCFEGVSFRVG